MVVSAPAITEHLPFVFAQNPKNNLENLLEALERENRPEQLQDETLVRHLAIALHQGFRSGKAWKTVAQYESSGEFRVLGAGQAPRALGAEHVINSRQFVWVALYSALFNIPTHGFYFDEVLYQDILYSFTKREEDAWRDVYEGYSSGVLLFILDNSEGPWQYKFNAKKMRRRDDELGSFVACKIVRLLLQYKAITVKLLEGK
jgi:hypothetical protein